jgi:hypothetical protein
MVLQLPSYNSSSLLSFGSVAAAKVMQAELQTGY